MESEIQVGDIREFEGEKSIAAVFGIWAEKVDEWIYINLTCDRENFRHVAVVNNPDSTMYHRTLFRDLRRLLIAHGKWPYGEEGVETESE